LRLWIAGIAGLLIFFAGLAAGRFYPVVNILWLLYSMGLFALVFSWTKHINRNLDNFLMETPDSELSQRAFLFPLNIKEFARVHRSIDNLHKKIQLIEFNLLNQKARQAGEIFNLMLSNTTDPLTGVSNRRELDRYLEKILGKMRPMSVIMIDIDHFKKVNDTYGHSAGDVVLQQFAATVKGSIRPADFLGRYGGEEFMVVCGADLQESAEIAERVRITVSKTPINVPENITISITASMGVAEYNSEDTIETLVKRADNALYRAKQGGRNRVCKNM
jgi:diguanylate cyclase (GGDEF)-like protein